MDKLWTDHVTWTRIVITDFDSNAPDLKPDLARLLRNQVDIGNAIKPCYGAAAGKKLTGCCTHLHHGSGTSAHPCEGRRQGGQGSSKR
jgi:hypothetical protein